MTWAYADRPEMTAQLAEAYTLAGNEKNALVIPAGLAFARALATRPGLELHTSDRRHPSLAATYLASCAVYVSLYGRPPQRLVYLAGLPAKTAAFLQSVAWYTVRDYCGSCDRETGGAAVR